MSAALRGLAASVALLSVTVLAAPQSSPPTTSQSPQAVADDLLAADRGFAAAAAGKPAADAVAAMLDDDVVMFIVPQPPLAKGRSDAVELLGKAFAGDASSLSWAPVRAGVSADGTQGFTYGFATRTIAGKPPILGKYVTYWIKRPAGWRVAAFKLVPREEGPVSTEVRPAAVPERLVGAAADAATIAAYRADLDETERAFSDESQVVGLAAGFRKYGSADAMNVGGGADFTYGNETIAAGFGTDKGSPLRWAPDGVLVASSGDLGITYGYLERNGAVPPGRLARIPWFTVWRRVSPQVPWRYVAE
jgi:ketosteroid isomerase-like protein